MSSISAISGVSGSISYGSSINESNQTQFLQDDIQDQKDQGIDLSDITNDQSSQSTSQSSNQDSSIKIDIADPNQSQFNIVKLGDLVTDSFAGHMVYNKIQDLPDDGQKYVKGLIEGLTSLNAIANIVDLVVHAYSLAQMSANNSGSSGQDGNQSKNQEMNKILDIMA